MGSKQKSSASSSTSTSLTDNRQVNDAGGGIIGTGNTIDASVSSSDDDFLLSVVDSSDRSVTSVTDSRDLSDRSVTNVTGTDPGVTRIHELNAQLLQAQGEQQSDAVRAVAALGGDTLQQLGESFTDLFSTASARQASAWESTVERSGDVIDKLLTATQQNSDGARALAGQALNSYQPSESKAGDTLKWVALAAAAVAGLMIFKKA